MLAIAATIFAEICINVMGRSSRTLRMSLTLFLMYSPFWLHAVFESVGMVPPQASDASRSCTTLGCCCAPTPLPPMSSTRRLVEARLKYAACEGGVEGGVRQELVCHMPIALPAPIGHLGSSKNL